MRGFPAAALLSLAFALVVAACGGGSDADEAAEPVPTPVIGGITESTPTPVPASASGDEAAAVPTPVTEPTAVSESALLDAAVRAYTASPLPEDTVAFDVLDQQLRADGLVELTVCTWNGASVFDEVREVLVRVDLDTVQAVVQSTSPTAGECLNRGLVESALAFATIYQEELRKVLLVPETFGPDPFATLMTPRLYEVQAGVQASRVADGLTSVAATLPEVELPENVIADVMWRRWVDDGEAFFGLVVCQPMDPDHGLYRSGVLVDDFRGDFTGEHSVKHYRMTPAETPSGWRMVEVRGLVWSDCLLDDWPGAVNEWRPDPAVWQVWER